MTTSPTVPIDPFEHVSIDDAGRRVKSLSYERFAVLAIAAIQEQKPDHDARLDALERRLAAQEGNS